MLCSTVYAQHSVLITPDESEKNRLIFPEDIVYQGAFKFPKIKSGSSRWGYGGSGLTYYPGGDPDGAEDGYPGSLYGIGHDWHQLVSEISIPIPVISKNYKDLNTAGTLQPFADITGGLLHRKVGKGTIKPDKVGGLAYLPKQGNQLSDKIYWNVFKYYHVMPGDLYSHGWSNLDLARPDAKGLWHVGSFGNRNYSSKRTANYLFEIPIKWGDEILGGRYLITGKADGPGSGGNSHGPAMYAYAPYLEGNPPPDRAELDANILVMYPPSKGCFPDWSHCDKWGGGAWLTTGKKSAVVIIGRKGLGEAFYGVGRPDDCSKSKGYHCTPYETQFLFYDPSDLAAVARGKKKYYEVLPYLIFRPKDFFWSSCSGRVGGAAFDRKRGHLYIVQRKGENPVVHVFSVRSSRLESN